MYIVVYVGGLSRHALRECFRNGFHGEIETDCGCLVYEIVWTRPYLVNICSKHIFSLVNPHILKIFSPRGHVGLSSFWQPFLLAATLELSLRIGNFEDLQRKKPTCREGITQWDRSECYWRKPFMFCESYHCDVDPA